MSSTIANRSMRAACGFDVPGITWVVPAPARARRRATRRSCGIHIGVLPSVRGAGMNSTISNRFETRGLFGFGVPA